MAPRKDGFQLGSDTPGKLEKLLQRKLRFSLPPVHDQHRRPHQSGIVAMQERASEPKVGDEVMVEEIKYRIRGIIFEEGAVMLAHVSAPDNEVTRLLWHPTWEWDNDEKLLRATNYRLLESLE